MPPASPADRHAHRVRRARARLPLSALVLFVAPALVGASILSACSLDWAVRPEPSDASLSETGSGADVTDAPVARDAAESSVPTDAPTSPDAADCAALTNDVAQKRKRARDCQSAGVGQCTTTVDDECGCKVIVTTAGAPFTNEYTAAVAALLANCGKPACTASCPQLGLMTSWACLAPTGQFTCTP